MKNKLKSILALSLFTVLGAFAQSGDVGIGTTSPDASAALDITSTTKGLLIPRMSTSQRDAIVAPANGLSIYNTTTNQLEYNSGTTLAPIWKSASASSAWSLTGNAGTNSNVDPLLNNDFLGTTDGKDISLLVKDPAYPLVNGFNYISRATLGGTTNPYTMQVFKVIENYGNDTFSWRGLTSTLTESTANTTSFQRLQGVVAGVNKNGAGNLSINLLGMSLSTNESNTASGTVPTIQGISNSVNKSGTAATTLLLGQGTTITHPAGAGTVTNITGQDITLSTFKESNTFTTIQGLNMSTLFRGNSSTATNLYGINLTTGTSSTTPNTVTNLRGINNSLFLRIPATITNAYGYIGNYDISSNTTRSTVTNLYQLYLGTTGTLAQEADIQNNWAIYTNRGLNSFGDNIEQRGTGYLKLASGTTAQRPATATAGMTRFNSTLLAMEYYDGSAWSTVAAANAITNLYSADGTLTSNRTVNQGVSALNFTGSAFTTFNAGNVGIGTTTPTSKLQVVGLPTYVDNAAAITAGLTPGAFYHTGDGIVRVVL